MDKNFLANIKCINCHNQNIDLITLQADQHDIREGVLYCAKCQSWFYIEDSILRIMPDTLRLRSDQEAFLDKYKSQFEQQVFSRLKEKCKDFSLTKNQLIEQKMISQDELASKTTFLKRTKGRNHLLKAQELLNKLNLKSHSNILEVGLGNGLHAKYLLDKTIVGAYAGLDISFSMLKLAKQVLSGYKINLIQADLEDLPFKENIFDNIFAVSVLQNLKEPIAGLEGFRKILKPDCSLLSMDYNRRFFGNFLLQNKEKFNKLKKENLIIWLKDAGYRKVLIDNFLFCPGFLPLGRGLCQKINSRLAKSFMSKHSMMLVSQAVK